MATEQITNNTGWDKIATEMIVASGNLAESPALNWYARHRLDAANLADDTSRLFLGIQLGCARCHNHPHEKWKLDDFYGLAAFYSGLKKDELTRVEKMQRQAAQAAERRNDGQIQDRGRRFTKATGGRQTDASRVPWIAARREEPSSSITVEIKGKEETYPAKFLLQPKPAHFQGNQREKLAAWIVSPENPYFSQAIVNRVWGMFMGKGFVHPVDDMGGSNDTIQSAIAK